MNALIRHLRQDRRKYLILAVGALSTLFLDQLSKQWVHGVFRLGESRPIIDCCFALTYVRNRGAAFSFLHDAPAVFREPFFIIVPLLALFLIGAAFSRLRNDQTLAAVAFSLVFGGAVGNLIDRVRLGFVIDFLDLHWKSVYHWPRFNIADSCIVVGIGLILYHGWKHRNTESREKTFGAGH